MWPEGDFGCPGGSIYPVLIDILLRQCSGNAKRVGAQHALLCVRILHRHLHLSNLPGLKYTRRAVSAARLCQIDLEAITIAQKKRKELNIRWAVHL
jgi:hypothetical protein